MLKAPTEFLVAFIIISVIIMLALVVFITLIIYRYQQKQNIYFKDIEALQSSHENSLLQSQLEIQEHTLQNISREIHDNIGQKLTLAKLYLNTLDYTDSNITKTQVIDSVNIIGEAINNLSDLSRSMSSDIILNKGLIKALEFESEQFAKLNMFAIQFSVTGDPVFLNTNTELVLFRIVQEALNNIVKHAYASAIQIKLHYNSDQLILEIKDDGKGFHPGKNSTGNGLENLKKRTTMLHGDLNINSKLNAGTQIIIEIPLYDNSKST